MDRDVKDQHWGIGGGPDPFAHRPAAGQQGDSLQQEGSEQKAPPIPGFEPQTPEVIAMKLKESLEGIRQSSEYLKNADFVKNSVRLLQDKSMCILHHHRPAKKRRYFRH